MAYKVIGGVVELDNGVKVQGNAIEGAVLTGRSVAKGNGSITIVNEDTGVSKAFSFGQTISLP
ncbi:hypothetical protein ACLHDG_09040 [Sulfurovum sp. CS9]|uniref:hypothetical protein n=1 Tax=Sulfurovum sp. CS9 TaxID=3391146 RepID=UPI0039E7A7AC